MIKHKNKNIEKKTFISYKEICSKFLSARDGKQKTYPSEWERERGKLWSDIITSKISFSTYIQQQKKNV